MSALNEDMCRQVAQAGGGAYIHVENNSAAQDQLDKELDKLAKKETTSTVYSEFDEQFQAVAILALLLLILEICIFDRRNPLIKRLSLFKRKSFALLAVISLSSFLLPLSTHAQTADRQYIREGNKQFRLGQYDKAEVSYRKAVEKNPKNPQAAYNLGNALMAQKKDSAAVQQFEQFTRIETNPLRKAAAYHNMGVICQTHKMYDEAIEAYKNALRNNPNDDETRYNLVLCKHMKKKQDEKQKQNQQNQDDQNKKDDQKKDDKKDQKQDKKEDKQQEQQKPQMSKDNAEQLLNAAIQNEKMTQDKMKKAQQQPQRRAVQKNW
jgi:Ca-activated chloride channel family protein